jgi:hypothetical protein
MVEIIWRIFAVVFSGGRMRNMAADDAVTVHSDSHHPFGMTKGGRWLTDKKATMILCSVVARSGKKILVRTADVPG